jgi:betaine-aldehyde dehydrogenase
MDQLMLIDGQRSAAQDGGWIDSVNPADETPLGRVPAATTVDIARAVEAARKAQIDWRSRSIFERGGLLKALAAQLRADAAAIIELEARDTGNTLAALPADVNIAAAYLEYFAGLATEMKGETVPATAGGLHLSVREPYGVVARIAPFNHPFMFAAAHLAAPLTAGNTVVVKTPESSPLTGGLLAEACRNILPPGVVNIVSGLGRDAGDPLVRHPDVPRIGFTGSLPTGLAIQRAAAETAVKSVTLELGGKNPFIVFPDANIEEVAAAAVAGMNFAWAGQSCGSTSRLLIHESIFDEVIEAVTAAMRRLRVGDPLDARTQMGPINNAAHYQRVMSLIEASVGKGGKLITGGQRPAGAEFEQGYWCQPTLFLDDDNGLPVSREEVFGPVLTAARWSDLDAAITLANDTPFGLTAAVWTNDLAAALKTSRSIDAGYVWINGVSQHYVGTPFGGWKNSGLGGEESLGELLSYTRSKTIHIIAK